MRSNTGTRSTVSSKTMTTPEPSVAPAARVASKVSARSSSSGPTKTPAAPPRSTACSGRPPATPPASSSSSPRRDPERHLVEARPLDAAGHAEELGAGRLLGADRGVGRHRPRPRSSSTFSRVSTLLTTRRLAEQSRVDRERRLVPRLAAVPLDRVEERRLLAADVGAGAAAKLDVEADAVAHHVVAEEAVHAGLVDGVAKPSVGQRVLAAQVEVAPLAAGREAGDRHRLDQRERVALHHDAVLERARLGLVGVADQVMRRTGRRATASHLRPVGKAAPPRPDEARRR